MIRLSNDRVNACVAKVAYPTRLAAELARNALIRKHGVKERLYIYKCPWTVEAHYHLGRVRRRKHGSCLDSAGNTHDRRGDWSGGDGNYGNEWEE